MFDDSNERIVTHLLSLAQLSDRSDDDLIVFGEYKSDFSTCEETYRACHWQIEDQIGIANVAKVEDNRF